MKITANSIARKELNYIEDLVCYLRTAKKFMDWVDSEDFLRAEDHLRVCRTLLDEAKVPILDLRLMNCSIVDANKLLKDVDGGISGIDAGNLRLAKLKIKNALADAREAETKARER